MNHKLRQEMAARLSALKDARNLTHKEIADDLNYSVESIKQCLTSGAGLSQNKQILLADYFDCTLEYIYGRSIHRRTFISDLKDETGLSINAVNTISELIIDPDRYDEEGLPLKTDNINNIAYKSLVVKMVRLIVFKHSFLSILFNYLIICLHQFYKEHSVIKRNIKTFIKATEPIIIDELPISYELIKRIQLEKIKNALDSLKSEIKINVPENTNESVITLPRHLRIKAVAQLSDSWRKTAAARLSILKKEQHKKNIDIAADFNIKIEIVNQWFSSGAGLTENVMMQLSDYFDCDLDYLYGLIPCKTNYIFMLQNRTGLHETVLNELVDLALSLNNLTNETDYYYIINILFSNTDLLKSLIDYAIGAPDPDNISITDIDGLPIDYEFYKRIRLEKIKNALDDSGADPANIAKLSTIDLYLLE